MDARGPTGYLIFTNRPIRFFLCFAFLTWRGPSQVVYFNRPVQDGDVHLSAPFIYADALEELQPKPGMSFLNIVSIRRNAV